MSDSDFQQILDVKGLKCPMPMLRTKKALAKMQPGEKLLVQATDPHALRDLSQFADQTGNKLLSSSDEDGIINIVMQRKENNVTNLQLRNSHDYARQRCTLP